MARVKRGVMHVKRRRNILKQAKGFMWGGKNLIKKAKEHITKAGVHAYVDRRGKKREKSALWNIKINAAVRPHELNYSRFMHLLKTKNIEMDRKALADLAQNNPDVFQKVINEVK